MASELQNTLGRIITKSNVLIEKYRILEGEKNAAEKEIQELREQVGQLRQELEQLRQDNEYLKMARVIMPDASQLTESRAIVHQLVRDVDKCISQLT